MKWLRFLLPLLVVAAVAVGCSSPTADSVEAPPPAADEVDAAQETAALEAAEGQP